MRKQFLTTEVVEVEEMSLANYYESEGLGNGETSQERVYKVFHKDGTTSMCPKDRFLEQAYEIENNKIPEKLVEDFIVEKNIYTKIMFGKKTTVMEYKLANGFTGIDSTSSVDDKNYSEEIGAEILLERVKNQIWYGLGFSLGMADKKRQSENTISKTHIERMEDELQALEIKLDNLCTFLEKEMEEPQYTNEYQRQLLAIQMSHMIGYYNTLLARIDNDKNIKKEV